MGSSVVGEELEGFGNGGLTIDLFGALPAAREEEEPEEEPSEGSDHDSHFGDRGPVDAPGEGHELGRERGHDDHEALEPHADVDQDRRDKQDDKIRAHFFPPEHLRHDDVADNHAPVRPPVRSERAVDEREHLVIVAAVPRDKKFAAVRVPDHHAGDHQNFRHVL